MKKVLVFTDLTTGESWRHYPDEWILTYCNFNSWIHPSRLGVNQSIEVTDTDGHQVKIEMKKEISDENG